MELPPIEPYKIKMVEHLQASTPQQRAQWIEAAHFNLFQLASDQVLIDLLTDSGTGAMSDLQWAELMRADESYAGSRSFYLLRDTVQQLLGMPYFLPTHQGRAAENVLFSVLVKSGDWIPGNAHFDTTKGHIEFRQAVAIDCTIDQAADPANPHPFKGNIDLDKLQQVFDAQQPGRIPFVLITATCNSVGGQPVSMANIRAVAEMAHQHGSLVVIDAARFAENAYFIKTREAGYADWSIEAIVHQMFSYADAATMSSKKDGIANMGGFIALRHQTHYEQACTFNILFEGYVSYGGMSGRDMAALAQGLREACRPEYLRSRIHQVRLLGELLQGYGVPVLAPFGGHAVFVDALAFFPHLPRHEFPAQTLAVELYLEAGIRSVEIGTLLADRDPQTRQNRYPKLELLRLALPRRVYTESHIRYIAAALARVWQRRHGVLRGLQIVHEAPILRHFTVQLARSTDAPPQASTASQALSVG